MNPIPLLLSAAILVFGLPINPGFAQTVVTIPTQVIPSISGTQSFGRSVEIDGTRAIVEEGEAVYILEFNSNRWDLSAELPFPDRSFMGSVALDGNTAAVQYGTGVGSNQEAVLGVFELSNNTWIEVASFALPSSANASNNTNPLAVSGNTIVVGVREFDGAAHVYEKIDNVWRFTAEFNSPGTGSELPPVFARDLDVNDDTIVISQTSVVTGQELNHILYFYKRIDGVWFLESQLPVIGQNNLGSTHKVVALSENRLIVAVRNGALVFDLINGNWTQVQSFGPSNLATNTPGGGFMDESIVTVSLDSTGTQAALGSFPQERVFRFQLVNGEWVETELSSNNNPLRFGVSLSIEGEHLLAGSLGALYYYRLNQTSQCIDADGDGFGWNGFETCDPTSSAVIVDQPQPQPQPEALQCIDTDGDGFGWNGVESCIPGESEQGPVADQTLACLDADGDGFGWNGVETCVPGGGEQSPVVNQSLACIDADGDGFGWNGVETCIPGESEQGPVADQSLACIDTDGDGFGWDGFASCIP